MKTNTLKVTKNETISKFYNQVNQIMIVDSCGNEWWHSKKIGRLFGYNVDNHYADKFLPVVRKAVYTMSYNHYDLNKHFLYIPMLYEVSVLNDLNDVLDPEDIKNSLKDIDDMAFTPPDVWWSKTKSDMNPTPTTWGGVKSKLLHLILLKCIIIFVILLLMKMY